MCGIAGFFTLSNGSSDWRGHLDAMTSVMAHRGPDADGHWIDPEAGIAFGHRRLSIIDLSPEGHQPMSSVSGRYQVCFNGEIYNFHELRRDLDKANHRFRGHSDTEVMLAAFEQWGVEASVKRFVGMFAFALWDRKERVMYLVRDRLGEKPLYYGWMRDTFLFGSELKALRAHPAWQAEINRNAIALLMRHNYIPAPYSIYKGISKLPPGTILTLSLASLGDRRLPNPVSYWSAKQAAEAGVEQPFTGSDVEAVDELESLLKQSVRQQMVADVPVGAFLSGGIDSATIVALMQKQSSTRAKTFTIGFHEKDYDEAKHAKSVAQFLGTDHTELYLTPEEAMAVIPKLPSIYDEPFSDSSQIPTLLVSQLARRYVTVSLSGDAGDELFCGYNRYRLGRNLWRKVNYFPAISRQGIARALCSLPVEVWDGMFGWTAPLFAGYGRRGSVGDKMYKLAEVLGSETADLLYRRIVSHWKETNSLVYNSTELPTVFTEGESIGDIADFSNRMMLMDTLSYLPDDILVKVDRASMAVSLESRVPFLDHRVVEFAWRVPMKMKFRDGNGKWLLRQLLYRYLPKDLIDRPKMGFGVPIGKWLRGPLREWAESLLNETRLRNEGFLSPNPIREKWEEHLAGQRNWQYYLWDVLMFQSWLAEQTPTALSTGSQCTALSAA
jgi:asparagine synthase (glutamine-hydrolysing)